MTQGNRRSLVAPENSCRRFGRVALSLVGALVWGTATAFAQSAGPGDANCDGTRDRADLDALVTAVFIGPGDCPDADANGDGIVNAADVPALVRVIDVVLTPTPTPTPTATSTATVTSPTPTPPPSPRPTPSGPTASVAQGTLIGFTEDGAHVFRGAPYAAPPVGPLRFRPPEPPAPFPGGERAAQSFSEVCYQPADTTDNSAPPVGSEDCLYLNVWTPADRSPGARLPVMVFLHGGANLTGAGNESIDRLLDTTGAGPLYGGARLAARGDVVVVTLNYRLGALGFLAHESLVADGSTGSAGNYGLMDQIAALKWVQTNITAFGGDPDRVLLFGQSAGAYDVCAHLASPRSAGLFSRAAMHSGSCALHSLETARANARALVAEVGCGTASDIPACLRAVPAGVLTNADAALPLGLGSFRMYPAVDGYLLDRAPIEIVSDGAHNRVPYLVGSTSEEYLHRFKDVPLSSYEAVLTALVGAPNLEDVQALYPLDAYDTPGAAISAAISDRNVTCPAGRFAGIFSQHQTAPVWRYYFTRTASTPARRADGAYHTSELLFLFQNMSGERFAADEADRLTEAAMLRFWTRFAATGNPNGGSDPVWTEYSGATDPYMRIDAEPAPGARLLPAQCDYWLGRSGGAEDPPGATLRLGPPGVSVSDPEFLNDGDLAAWQTAGGEIRLAPVDPASGLFSVEDAQRVDTGAVSLLESFNGPEFGLQRDGWSLFYTKQSGGVSQIWRAAMGPRGEVVAAPLTAGVPHTTPIVSQDAGADDVLVVNIRGSWAAGDVTWYRDSAPALESVVAPVDTRATTHPTWIPGADTLIFREPAGAQRGQLFLLDTETGARAQITDDAGDKTFPFGWFAPDHDGALLAFALLDQTAIAVYRDLGGTRWSRVATLPIPAESGGVTLGSAEPFVAAGRSFVSLSVQTNASSTPGEADAQVWVFSVDPDPADRIALRCDDGQPAPAMRIDPESFLGAEQVYVYYNLVRPRGVIEAYRCATGIPTR